MRPTDALPTLILVATASLVAACNCGSTGPADSGCVEPADWCQSFGKNCGLIPGRCSDAVRCGSCTMPDTCGGAGVENVCGRPGGAAGGAAGGTAGGSTAGGATAGGATAGGGTAGGGTAGGGTASCGGLVGCACSTDSECLGTEARCQFGTCTVSCTSTAQCNGAGISAPGPLGGVFTCWPPVGARSCWPNGSGVSCPDGGGCPRADEGCIQGVCQYARLGSPTTVRPSLTCHFDAECRSGEGCVPYAELDGADIRIEGACLFAGTGPVSRQVARSPCTADAQCASYSCRSGRCAAMCDLDARCSTGEKCVVAPGPQPRFAEFSSAFIGWCTPWSGSRAACSSNALCSAGEACAPYTTLASDTALVVAGACRSLPNPAGASTGAACTTGAQCASGDCRLNPLTARGYCSAPCLGGAADCAGGTVCRPLLVDTRDPARAADDLRMPACIRTGVGEACFNTPACKSCSADADCAPAEGVTCDLAGGNVCRDRLGRCLDPCRHNCQVGGAGCPAGATCVSVQGTLSTTPVCLDNATGACVRASLYQPQSYEHGMCGDPSGGNENDLCYYFGRDAGTDVFACGSGCVAPATCPAISLADGGTLATLCRTTHEFGVPLSDGGTLGGAAQLPTQCAPASAF